MCPGEGDYIITVAWWTVTVRLSPFQTRHDVGAEGEGEHGTELALIKYGFSSL